MLSKSIFVIGLAALYNSLQCFIPAMSVTSRIYAHEKVSPLTSRLMGTWTLISAIVRIYGSFYLDQKPVYDLVLATFLVALFSFTAEVFVYKTAPISSPGVWPALIVASSHTIWMLSQYPPAKTY